MIVYVDGQNTPTDSVICVIVPVDKEKIVKKVDKQKDILTIEKLALLEGIKQAIHYAGKNHNCPIISDSVGAVSSFYSDEFFKEVRDIIKSTGKKIIICWLPREENLAGIELEKRLGKSKRPMKKMRGLKI